MTDIDPVSGDAERIDNTVRWALSFDCQLTFGIEHNQLRVTVSTTGEDQEKGLTRRGVTAWQLRNYAFKLADLANTFEVRQRATAAGCDGSLTCGGDRHHPMCLGAYRTCDEVESGTVPALEVLVRRRRDHVELAQLGRMQAARYGGGPDAA